MATDRLNTEFVYAPYNISHHSVKKKKKISLVKKTDLKK